MRYNVRVFGSFNRCEGRCALRTFSKRVGGPGVFNPRATFLHPFRGAVESFASGAAGRELETVQKSELASWT